MPRRFAVAVLLFAVFQASAAFAGWRIQEVDPEFPEEAMTYWFQGGKARVEGALEGLVILIDVKAQTGWLVEEGARRYAGGKIDELAEQLSDLENEGLPEDEELLDDEDDEMSPGKVEVKAMGPGERLLGYETSRYQVIVDGELLEELWVAPKVAVEGEVDPGAFASAMQLMLGGGTGLDQGYEQDPAYVKVRSAGYPLRQVLYFVGEKSVLDVTAVEQKTFPDATFAVPSGLAKTGYVELLVGEDSP